MSILIKPKIDLSRAVDIPRKGDIVHIKGYGMIKVFKNFIKDDDFECWATNDLNMNDLMRLRYAETI
uniref:hypothetical protein n=1 Tax=Candidatus Electronema sp. TaxID=2698783 RepID=UPI004055A1DB